MPSAAAVLVLGLGNRLLGDDAAGPWVLAQLIKADDLGAGVVLVDGGTVGLALLPLIEDACALVVVDAARMGAVPGTVRVFEGPAMDALLGGPKDNAHEVALADLMAAAALRGTLPARRALVAVQPARVDMCVDLSPEVAAALPALGQAARALCQRWLQPALDELELC